MEVKERLIPDVETVQEYACPVKWAQESVEIAWRNSDGRDVMSRDGMAQVYLIIRDITSGKAKTDDIEMLKDICEVIASSQYELSRKAAENVLFSIENYAEEWDLHSRRHRCSSLECKSYYSLYIDPSMCKGCHDCIKLAPEKSILYADSMISIIEDDTELKTKDFIESCPNGAIKKAGAVKPKLPEKLVEVGSFGSETGARRRRRR